MKLIYAKDYKQLSELAASYIIERVRQKPSLVLGLATGGTPEGTYQEIIRDHKETGTSYQNATSVNLDEYVGLAPNNPNSYHFYMKAHLFNHIDIKDENIHLPHGMAEDLEKECQEYDELIEKLGGADIQLLGIGTNGHIGFNEPFTPFDIGTHVITLTPSTREANARFFEGEAEVPTQAITMGIKQIMCSREILLLASGKSKAAAIKRLIQGDVNESFPASILKKHSRVIIVADEDALSQLTEAERSRIDD